MLIEDTVNSRLDDAPLINAALGITIRGAGLSRHTGGMRGFWRGFMAQYRSIGGEIRLACKVERIVGRLGGFRITTSRGEFEARQVVSAIPAEVTAAIAPPEVGRRLEPFLRRDAGQHGGAILVCLGVPEAEVDGQAFTHHQLLQDYSRPLGDGNNMFVSVSSPGDYESAPPGFRAVMISTHCELEPWQCLTDEEHCGRKRIAGERLVKLARRVYPHLGENALVSEVASPLTYARFTGRPQGEVGGVRQTLANSNQNAIPHRTGCNGFWLVGDSTWPGLGTVACVLSSRIVSEAAIEMARFAAQPQFRFAPIARQEALDGSPTALTRTRPLNCRTSARISWQHHAASVSCPWYVPLSALRPIVWPRTTEFWWLTPVIGFLIFVAVVTVTHDAVHGALGLSRRQTDWTLFLNGLVVLESGHAYRITHLQHHRIFPSDDDPEGDPARLTLLQAILNGPLFLPRLWWWAYRTGRRDRAWLLAEAAVPIVVVVCGILLWRLTPAVLWYAAMVIVGSWVYPLLTVHLPHRHYGDEPLTQTHTLRGRVIPALFLELTYHLEHHLYPQVPSHHLAELSRRLAPFFTAAGVQFTRVP